MKHAHKNDTDHDAKITTKKPKRHHHHECVHSDTNTTHDHVYNNITTTCNSKSSSAKIDSALTSTARATEAQQNANNTEELGIEMCSDVLGKGWLQRYDELIAFKQQHGHCNVPAKYAQNKPLGRWVSTQRTQYKLLRQGKQYSLTAERQAALEKIGFEWGLHESSWQTRYSVCFKIIF